MNIGTIALGLLSLYCCGLLDRINVMAIDNLFHRGGFVIIFVKIKKSLSELSLA